MIKIVDAKIYFLEWNPFQFRKVLKYFAIYLLNFKEHHRKFPWVRYDGTKIRIVKVQDVPSWFYSYSYCHYLPITVDDTKRVYANGYSFFP